MISDRMYTAQEVLGQNQSPTALGKQIVCIAEYWYLQKVREIGDTNKLYAGGDIMMQQYDKANGTNFASVGAAWCVIFPWFIINEINKNYYSQVWFPNTAGAKDALNQIIKANKYPVEKNPTAGAIFYRYSEDKTASGHMGVVIFVDNQNQKFYTIEGNIAVVDGGQGIGMWEYDISEIPKWGFQFAHIEESGWNYSQPQTYKDKRCLPDEKKEEIKKEEKVISTGGSVTSGEAIKKSLGGGSSTSQQTQQTTVIDKSKCKEIVIHAPSQNNATLIDVFANDSFNPAIAADILEMDATGVSSKSRNGAALGYIGESNDTGEASGFGMFRLAGSNVGVYILPKTSTKAKQLSEAGLISGIPQPIMADRGTNHLMYSTNAIVLTHSHDPMDNRRWKISNHQIMNGNGTYFPLVFHDSKTNADPQFEAWRRNWTSKDRINFKELLLDLNQKASKMQLTKPVVIVIDKTEEYTFVERLRLVSNITSSMVSFFPSLKDYIGIVNDALLATESIATNGFAGIIDSAQKIFNIARVLAPEEIKGANDYFLKIGLEAYTKSIESSKVIGDLIGLDSSVINGLTKRYTAISESVIDFTKTIDSNLNNVVCKAQNFLNHLLVEKAGSAIKSDRFLDAILNNELMQSNIFNDILLINHQTGILPTIPGIGKLAIQMITDPEKTMFKNVVDSERLKQGLIKTSLGYVTDKNLFDNWLISTLNAQANKVKDYFVLPAGIDENKKECFAYVIEQETGRKVINCPKGWNFDPISKKCTNGSQTGWTPTVDKTIPTNNDIIKYDNTIITKKICPPNFEWDESLGVCKPIVSSIKCPDGFTWDAVSKVCVPIKIECPPGTTWNETSKKCEANVSVGCPSGTTWNPITKKCEYIVDTPTIKIPACIQIIDKKYYYNPNWKAAQAVKEPIKQTPISTAPVNTKTDVVSNDLLKNAPSSNITPIKSNTGGVTIPLKSEQSKNPISTVSTDILASPVSTTLPTLTTILPIGTVKSANPTASIPSGKTISGPIVESKSFYGLNDTLYEAAVAKQGTPLEEWYVNVNGEWQILKDCVPTPIKVETPIIKCPDGFVWDASLKACVPIKIECPEGYIYNTNTKKCEPKQPTIPVIPPTEPKQPTIPVIPPTEPKQPTIPVIPPTEPKQPTIPVIPPTEPKQPTIPVIPPTEPKRPSEPPTIKRVPPDAPPTRDCPCDQPKMVEKYEKTYYAYPPWMGQSNYMNLNNNNNNDECCDE